ncbi:MAG: hypothetical protein HY689_01130 [Chloroflexi bacterium]|nr:hypothetical protein [Chloroflexota bacterium]
MNRQELLAWLQTWYPAHCQCGKGAWGPGHSEECLVQMLEALAPEIERRSLDAIAHGL